MRSSAVESANPYVDLLDYRRSVAEIYTAVRQSAHDPPASWHAFRAGRDALFRTHPQSALSETQKQTFDGLHYYAYDPAFRFLLPIDTTVEPVVFEIALEHDGVVRIQRFGRVHFRIGGQPVALSLFWILGYGGGIFVPFRDQTNSGGTYGGGRYIDFVAADISNGLMMLDFNTAYNPYCAYNPSFACPLPPEQNRMDATIRAGEKNYVGKH